MCTVTKVAKAGISHPHDASLHTILSGFRTHVILQFKREATVEQHWKATCFAGETFCAFAVLIFLRFSFWPSILTNLPSDHKAVYAASFREATTSCKST